MIDIDKILQCPRCGEYLDLDIFANGKCPTCDYIELGYGELPDVPDLEDLGIKRPSQNRQE